VGCRQGTSGLGLDDDGGDVVAHGVVEFAGQLVALTERGLLDVADPGVGVEANRRADRGGEQEEPVRADHVGSGRGIGDVRDAKPGQDEPQARPG
jgi:hypothetical protein